MGRSEALDLFRKWSSDKSLVRCQGSFPMYAFALNGRITIVDDHKLRIISDDTKSELVLKLTPDLDFHYADSRKVTGVAKEYDSCVAIFFSPVLSEQTPDSISIAVKI